jgi:hypothetical protein
MHTVKESPITKQPNKAAKEIVRRSRPRTRKYERASSVAAVAAAAVGAPLEPPLLTPATEWSDRRPAAKEASDAWLRLSATRSPNTAKLAVIVVVRVVEVLFSFSAVVDVKFISLRRPPKMPAVSAPSVPPTTPPTMPRIGCASCSSHWTPLMPMGPVEISSIPLMAARRCVTAAAIAASEEEHKLERTAAMALESLSTLTVDLTVTDPAESTTATSSEVTPLPAFAAIAFLSAISKEAVSSAFAESLA